jgi:hypothetical protein
MQTELEVKAIKKRLTDTTINSTKIFGVVGNEVKSNSLNPGDEYDINGSKNRKGGENEGSLVNHLNSGFDLTTGGDFIDTKERQKQQAYVIPGTKSYSEDKPYADLVTGASKIDTSKNIGQVVIW